MAAIFSHRNHKRPDGCCTRRVGTDWEAHLASLLSILQAIQIRDEREQDDATSLPEYALLLICDPLTLQQLVLSHEPVSHHNRRETLTERALSRGTFFFLQRRGADGIALRHLNLNNITHPGRPSQCFERRKESRSEGERATRWLNIECAGRPRRTVPVQPKEARDASSDVP